MKEKTDKSKLRDGRGLLIDNVYEAWKTAREAKSIGTAYAVYDPIQKRTVNLLSVGEKKVFWVLRYLTSGKILEQFPMSAETTALVCEELGIRKYSRILSTDLLVEKGNGELVAFSVKPNASVFDLNRRKGPGNVTRARVEAQYWSHHGVPHKVVYSDEIDIDLAMNIRDVMLFWDDTLVRDPASMLMHLIAHKAIRLPLDKGRIQFKAIAEKIPVEEYYETYSRCKNDPDFRGWILDLSGKYSVPYSQP